MGFFTARPILEEVSVIINRDVDSVPVFEQNNEYFIEYQDIVQYALSNDISILEAIDNIEIHNNVNTTLLVESENDLDEETLIKLLEDGKIKKKPNIVQVFKLKHSDDASRMKKLYKEAKSLAKEDPAKAIKNLEEVKKIVNKLKAEAIKIPKDNGIEHALYSILHGAIDTFNRDLIGITNHTGNHRDAIKFCDGYIKKANELISEIKTNKRKE